MISIKTEREIALMRKAGEILAGCFLALGSLVVAGAQTRDLDKFVGEYIARHGCIPSFRGQKGMAKGAPDYPADSCISINSEVIHGIPGPRVLAEGDIVSVDAGLSYNGYHSDMARTFFVGAVSEPAERLARATRQCFLEAMAAAVPGNRVSDISRAVQRCAEGAGFSVVRDYVGHGIGTSMHEEPQIPNFVDKPGWRGAKLQAGMTLAVEPMVNAGASDVEVLPNRWTVVTKDGSLSAHHENTILVREAGGPLVLSAAAGLEI